MTNHTENTIMKWIGKEPWPVVALLTVVALSVPTTMSGILALHHLKCSVPTC